MDSLNSQLETSNLSRIGFKLLLLVLGISVLFFLPMIPLGIVSAKGLILTIGAGLGIIIWLADSLIRGKFILPQNKTYLVLLGFVLATILSGFFSPSTLKSFIGSGFDFGTITVITIAFIYFFLLSVWSSSLNKKSLIKGIYIIGSVALVFQIAQLFLSLTTRFPKFFVGLSYSNLVGSFNDFALFLGAYVIMLVLLLEKNVLSKKIKIFSFVSLVVSLFFIFVINYRFVWIILGITGLSLFVYNLMFGHFKMLSGENTDNTKKSFPFLSFSLIVLAFVGIVFNTNIARVVANKPFNFVNNEPRPSLISNLHIIKRVYTTNPVVGFGPARFSEAWEINKSRLAGSTFMSTPYWNTSFTFGFSSLLTFIATVGILGSLFILWFVFLVGRSILAGLNFFKFSKDQDIFVTLFGIIGLYVFITFVFNVTSSAMLVVSFALFGLITSYASSSVNQINFIKDTRLSFFSIIAILAFMVLSLFGIYRIASVNYASYLANKASLLPTSNDGIAKAKMYLSRAYGIVQTDSYSRALSSVSLLATSLAISDTSKSGEELRAIIKDELGTATGYAQNALIKDPTNLQNHLSYSKIQESVIMLGDITSYDSAINTLDKALELSPNNPGIIYKKAKIANLAGKSEDALTFINTVLSINKNYIDAYLLKAQISVNNKNLGEALDVIRQGVSFNPSDLNLAYQESLLMYNLSQKPEAKQLLESIIKTPNATVEMYSSLVGMYEKDGEKDKAIRVLQDLQSKVGNSPVIDSAIEKVKSGTVLNATEIKEETIKEEDTIKSQTETVTN
jgi:tetratricopeptide (TPR) repeat protein